MRIGIRLKLALMSLFLFAIPWLGYRYVWELESYLRLGQEQTMVGTARAVATALHERPRLFSSQATFLQDVEPGKDLYAHKINRAIQLDGRLDDWANYQSLALTYAEDAVLHARDNYQAESLHFTHMVGQFQHYLYAMFNITDDTVVFRPANSLRIDGNDHLIIAMTTPEGHFSRFIIGPRQPGWVNAYRLVDQPGSYQPDALDTRIQGYWRQTASGYQVELRFPLSMTSGSIAFAVADVDDIQTRTLQQVVGTADPNRSDTLGTVLIPSPEIESILRGMRYANARMWVVDKHLRVLARTGSILSATGIRATSRQDDGPAWWQYIEREWLLPLYYRILTKPPDAFVDELENAYSLAGSELAQAMQGQEASLWRLSPDNKAVILSAAHPIFIDDQVMGAVIVEQTTHGIRSLRNRALEQLFHVILGVVVLGTLVLFVFASRMSLRIRRLRNATEAAIDRNGKIIGTITPSRTKDEIGDLSRSFHNVLSRLSSYHGYLENMGARLSHELRTPVAIVNSSLENLAMQDSDLNAAERKQYIQRAQQGIRRLSRILTNMSEATRLEQALASSEKERFDLCEVVSGCTEGYRLAYPDCPFELQLADSPIDVTGSADLFAQMLDKIITNAREFRAPDSAIEIRLAGQSADWQLTIDNHGPLLPENMQDQLLQSMVSVRQPGQDEAPHLGLGLHIANMIATYHDARLSLSNLADSSGVRVSIRHKDH
ncbi:proteobacterial dedicated sortase system histidine kinase [Aestuariibacter halophilus]|uniref:histidine kinase n=1 Tax=Fluctibacter halophilus TaxID=226011 RepID=A0ABS8G9A2_9ALTE|nr:proteobacterial dedicated sortase system histidine kinase [Aestuariibacter halophilus]MCC2617142.1 proteobacterial dedicated sortase system histidine kinase [Aestuariibacter halophilus]